MNKEIGNFVNLLTVGLTHAAVYYHEHPRVRQVAEDIVSQMKKVLEETGARSLFLGVVRKRLVFQGQPLVGPTLIARRVISCMEQLKCGGFEFSPKLQTHEMMELFTICAELHEPALNLKHARDLLEFRKISNIRLSPEYGERGWRGGCVEDEDLDGAEDENDLASIIPMYQGLLDVVENAHNHAVQGHDVNINAARTTVEDMLKAIDENADDLLRMSRYPEYDSYTIGHSVRVALFTLIVANNEGLGMDRLIRLGTAALLHDVGKARVPCEILLKKTSLSKDEWKVMNQHPIWGGELLMETEDSDSLSICAAFVHHLRADGGGYPDQPEWRRSGKMTTLIKVCDVFEALTAVRPYKPELSPAEAYEIMLRDTGGFDEDMFAAFVRAVGLYPPGYSVKLSTGMKAVVCKAGQNIARPLVRITHDEDNIAIEASDQPTVDLGDPEFEEVFVADIMPRCD